MALERPGEFFIEVAAKALEPGATGSARSAVLGGALVSAAVARACVYTGYDAHVVPAWAKILSSRGVALWLGSCSTGADGRAGEAERGRGGGAGCWAEACGECRPPA